MEMPELPGLYPSEDMRHRRLFVFFLLCIPLVQAFMSLNWVPEGQHAYGIVHYLFTYKFGFIKRGLAGQLLSGYSFLDTRHLVLVTLTVTAVCVAAVVAVVAQPFLKSPMKVMLLAFLLSGPGVLPHIAFQFSHLDNLQLILLAGAVGLFMGARSWMALTGVTLLSIFGLLIQEAFLFMFYPLIFLLVIIALREGRSSPLTVGLHFAAVAAAFGFIVVLGKLPVAPEEFLRYLQSRTDVPVRSVHIISLSQTPSDIVAYLIKTYDRALVTGIVLSLITSFPYFAALGYCLFLAVKDRPGFQLSMWATVLILCTPMGMVFLGHDVLRWASAVCINVTFYLAWVEWRAGNDEPRGEARGAVLFTRSPWFTASFAYCLVIGAFSVAGNRLVSRLAVLLRGG